MLLLVAMDHNQLRTVSSETVDPIDWSHPPPSWAEPSELHAQIRCKCDLQIVRLAAAQGARRSVHGYTRPTQGIVVVGKKLFFY